MSWLDAFFAGYNQVQTEGLPVVQRATTNYVGATVADDPLTKVTTVTIPTVAPVPQVSAKLVATSNITLSGTQTIDGVNAGVGDVVLVAGQSAPAENGLRTVALGVWPRTSDALVRGMAVFVQQGDVSAGATYTLLGSGAVVPDTTPLTFANLHDEFDIRLFGAVVDGVTDDGAALRLAMAATKANGRGTVLLPHGVVLVGSSGYTGVNTCGVLVDCDNVRIKGQGPQKSILKMASGTSYVPILVQLLTIGVDLAPLPVQSPQFEDFSIEYVDRGPDSAGSIQINNGQNFLVSKIHIQGDAAGMGGHNTDGLAMAFESTGRFTRVLCDGLSKGGLYIALGHNITGDAEVKNGYGVFQVGAQISGAYDCEVDLNIHDNTSPDSITGGVGVLWFVNTGLSPTISTLTSQTDFVIDFGSPRGDVYARYLGVFNTAEACMEVLDVASVSTSDGGTHYHVLLNAAPAQTLSLSDTLTGDYQPANNVKIRGSVHNVTHQGVSGASAITGGFATNIEVAMMVHDCGSYGINPTCIKGFTDNSTVQRCSAGVFAADVGTNATVEGLCRSIRLGGRYRNNGGAGAAGVYLSAVDDVTIDPSAEITTSDVATFQGVGIQVQGKSVAQPKACTVTASTNLVTATLHGYVAGNGVVFDTTANGITAGILYYVLAAGLTANDFAISTTSGGSPVDITSDGSNVVRRWKKCTDVKIGHFTDTGYSTSQVYHPNGTADAPDVGYYNHPLHSGSPSGGYYAPPGSILLDGSGGQGYIKSSAGAIATGWNRVVRDDDVDTAATANKIAKRDANANLAAGKFLGTQVLNVAGSLVLGVLTGNTLAVDEIDGGGNPTVALAAINAAGSQIVPQLKLGLDSDTTGINLWLNGNQQLTVGAAGAAANVPASPAIYFRVIVNGVAYLLPGFTNV